jgi:hypothetical protein
VYIGRGEKRKKINENKKLQQKVKQSNNNIKGNKGNRKIVANTIALIVMLPIMRLSGMGC